MEGGGGGGGELGGGRGGGGGKKGSVAREVRETRKRYRKQTEEG